ncbi:hypothetical protein SmJEL517_g03198 [Synchytrium microbalum]|uniref:Fatty acid hydroxylase domain-containing protein n=1 Tax=Synchytrium microbalum TaxID=1806994 RepID=A0A507C3D6_9FUNG|nr:uncharacterized protein SmJEL517_g03198 [Synchytrium microbalum]TPX33971.1 hypothetical protein SmJEL517_g03198 [Synchytrium microbalum]
MAQSKMKENVVEVLEGYGSLYLVDPSKTSFEHFNEVPNYIGQATPYFISTILFESLVQTVLYYHEQAEERATGKPGTLAAGKPLKLPRLNDSVTSMSAGLFMGISKIVLSSIEAKTYIWTFNNCRIFTMDAKSKWTWAFAFLGMDFGYYWFHRHAHEIALFWTGHQVHHSSEEYNQTTALRQSFLQQYSSWMFYLPLAVLGLPPAMFSVHKQLNTLFQYWIHTELVGKLGWLEYVINTPSQHRVHHGRNPYCIDKNYAGTLCIWDRIFGTYAEEKETEPVLYGLVHNNQTFDPFYIQLDSLHQLLKKWWNTPGGARVSTRVLFYGPGWDVTKPHFRFGDPSDLPAVPNLAKDPKADIGQYNPKMRFGYSMQMYTLVQFALAIVAQPKIVEHMDSLPSWAPTMGASYLLLCLTSIGRLFDNWKYAYHLEIFKLVVGCGLARYLVAKGGQQYDKLRKIVDSVAIVSSVYVLTHGYLAARQSKREVEDRKSH